MRRIIKGIVNRTWKPYVKWYLRKSRIYKYKNYSVTIEPGVFHPGFFFSTKLLISFLEKINLKGRNILEMGSGSGLVSIYAAGRNANIIACDISPLAVACTTENAKRNNIKMSVFQSDLFSEIPLQEFNTIIVNPPYFKKEPGSMEEKAWYCGENLEYFHRFFQQAKTYMNSDSNIIMVLSDECDLEGIYEIAAENSLTFVQVSEKRTAWETGYVFNIRLMKDEMH